MIGIWNDVRSALHRQRVAHAADHLIEKFGPDAAWVEAGKRHLALTKTSTRGSVLWREVADVIAHRLQAKSTIDR